MKIPELQSHWVKGEIPSGKRRTRTSKRQGYTQREPSKARRAIKADLVVHRLILRVQAGLHTFNTCCLDEMTFDLAQMTRGKV
ncbi:hypothetical protein ADUPG1_013115 [Aduncisulcus paluster]|uniref:Transposase n=1 Tax=Aduncisulcus paluster TaxID=2918883 RepID=A0ABQ5K5F1_9EUKA|nr:hypothetical protein ADUPG1_013115 [Aduncisulcus paluster]